ncbi:nucleotide exchange factor GrpE [Weissella coleopterorum]|uniref:Protein GrpE n=1 Tax=Weissella coleopterorum TaxID=2714949 RepID=A0A6G8B0P1_9LACO|nr:nucleotide exchange factor GrpE [Weissella coleopterorum]QIL50789.1 nucleotide exchange factor GrpE [Weissella coleopterorum]
MAENKAEQATSVDEELLEAVDETDHQTDSETIATDADVSNDENSIDVDPLQELQAKYDALEDKYLRTNAEMQNMQTRFAKEQAISLKYANQKLAKDILPALDNLERAINVDANDESAQQIKTGVEMVYKTLNSALADNDIKAVGVVGEDFDPEIHQSVQTQPADDQHPVDTVAQVLQKGYLLADRVVRPAMVVVYN